MIDYFTLMFYCRFLYSDAKVPWKELSSRQYNVLMTICLVAVTALVHSLPPTALVVALSFVGALPLLSAFGPLLGRLRYTMGS
ncbi:hypothetical protein SOVF_182700 [Spinacia oleracea]|nr:hypothetical protein SOVF_182700 [Spinacia oleracea]